MSTDVKSLPLCSLVVRIQPGVKTGDVKLEHFDVFDLSEQANYGRLSCWSHLGGGMGEACIEYYRETKKPKGPVQEGMAKRAAAMYHSLYNHSSCQWKYRLLSRLPKNYRELAGWYK